MSEAKNKSINHIGKSIAAINKAFQTISKLRMDEIIHEIDALPKCGPTITEYIKKLKNDAARSI